MRQYVVDAFTDSVFHGNQAAVCVMEKWPSEEMMMNITRENNFSETAFTVKEGEKWHLRWFTPGGEIDLCGHATLGTAFVLLNFYEKEADQVVFTTLSGELIVTRKGNLYEMEFPAYELRPTTVTTAMEEALGAPIREAYIARDLLCVLDDEQAVLSLNPDLEKIKQIDGLLVHVTAKGEKEDCVSRSFGPKLNIPEDPVCGSGKSGTGQQHFGQGLGFPRRGKHSALCHKTRNSPNAPTQDSAWASSGFWCCSSSSCSSGSSSWACAVMVTSSNDRPTLCSPPNSCKQLSKTAWFRLSTMRVPTR